MSNPRAVYLQDRLGLNFDPFAVSVAEQELKADQNLDLSEESPRFFAYFCQPRLVVPDGGELDFNQLRARQHTLIYGLPGAGKTTFRINLDADCRTVLDQTFAVHYLLGQDLSGPITAEEHGERLARAMARDLFVQILEQYLPVEEVSARQLAALRLFLDLGGKVLDRLVSQILKEPQPVGYAGLADHWRAVGRIPVRYTTASASLLHILRKVQKMPAVLPDNLQGWDKVWAARQAAAAWQVEAVLVLVDGVDAVRRQPVEMMPYLEPLLAKLVAMEGHQIYAKFFIPSDLAPLIDDWLSINPPDLKFSLQKATIVWTEEGLKRMLQKRFSAAGSRYKGFNELAQGELMGQLDNLILSEAQGSPRRLLWLVSNLINAHVASQPDQLKIDNTDWSLMHELGSALLTGSS